MTSRRHDPDTSKDAAAAIQEHVTAIQLSILQVLAFHAQGMSTRELAFRLSLDFATVSPRMAPMAEKGWVEMTPRKVKSPTGKGWGHVWVITPAGRGILR